jgi:glycosyltransferase involved in cell wall biosynthesis
MKILVVETFGTGGLIHFTYQLCHALAEEGCEVELITSDDYELAGFPHNFEVQGFMHLWPSQDTASMRLAPRSLPSRVWNKLRWTARRSIRAMKLAREWNRMTRLVLKIRPDIVQFSTIHFPFQAYFLSRLNRSGIILTQICHEYEQRDTKGGWIGSLNAKLSIKVYDSFSAIFFLAEQTRKEFLQYFDIPEGCTFTIPHGNQNMFVTSDVKADNARLRYGLQEDDKVILFFGVIRPSKGLPDLIEAFAMLDRDIDAKLLVVGYPTKHANMDEVQHLIKLHDLSDTVLLDPRYIEMEEVGPLLKAASVVVFPYRNATQSGVLHLAYSFGKPVIATSVGGLAEDVKDGETGYLVPPRSPAELAAAIERIFKDPVRLQDMGSQALELSKSQHSWKTAAGIISCAYKKLLSGKQVSGLDKSVAGEL